ncbi:hypothetical protein ABH920_008463 [Catenulispora sp. EB89]|uniref:hypothetical protein n=1 Tax=Catenulispora sp. EB89 TaxID=3156257 RepID=UPI003517378E
MASSAIGDFHVEQLIDEPSHQISRAVERFFHNRSRDDVLLLHISCHELKDDEGRLYFAAADTDHNSPASIAAIAELARLFDIQAPDHATAPFLGCAAVDNKSPGGRGNAVGLCHESCCAEHAEPRCGADRTLGCVVEHPHVRYQHTQVRVCDAMLRVGLGDPCSVQKSRRISSSSDQAFQ